jgi:hypothetical protein
MIMTNTYGDTGNRWWVGMNIGETGSQKTILGKPSLNLDRPNGYESLPSGNAVDDAQFAAAAVKDKGATKPVTISVENIQWFNIQGPYTTQAAANAAIPAIQAANPAPGVLGQVARQGTPILSPVAGAVAVAQSWEQALQQFLSELSSANLWIRVAKVAIGGTILLVGLAKLTGADQAIGGVAATAVKVAPLL